MPAKKNLIGIRWRVMVALRDGGWILRSLAGCKPEGVVLEPCRGSGAIGMAPSVAGGALWESIAVLAIWLRDGAIDFEARA